MQVIDANLIPYSPSRWLSYDDVLLLAQESHLLSRNDPRIDLTTYITTRFRRPTPIIAANMSDICEADMAIKLHSLGGMGILHRFYQLKGDKGYEIFLNDCRRVAENCGYVAFSIGSNKEDLNVVEAVLKICSEGNKPCIVAVDLAHGHLGICLDQIRRLSTTYGHKIEIISGSLGTMDGVVSSIQAGANAVRCGIGGGSNCVTSMKTGHGNAMFTTIMQARKVVDSLKVNISILADGSIKHAGDIVKAMGAGADACVLGSLFAGTDEASGPKKVENGRVYKRYAGQSSYTFNQDLGKADKVASEGITRWVDEKGPVEPIFKDLIQSCRSGLSYSGAKDWDELYKRATFIEITTSTHLQTLPHGLLL